MIDDRRLLYTEKTERHRGLLRSYYAVRRRKRLLSPHDSDLIRRDPAIPGLGTLLDSEAFLKALRAALPQAEVSAARPTYARYKPGMNCLVAYDLEAGGETVSVYAKGHRRDATEQFRKALDKPAVSGPLGPGRIVLHDRAIVLSVFPNDSEMKTLPRLAGGAEWKRLLMRLFPERPDFWEGKVKPIRYKPERRYVAQLLTDGSPQAAIKAYTDTGYAEAKGSARVFRSRETLTVPQLLGSSDRHLLLAFPWMEGRLLSEVLNDPEMDIAALKGVGVALAEVHDQKPKKLARVTRAVEASSLLAVAAGLSFLCPHLAGRIENLARRLVSALMRQEVLYAPLHGDFYAKQVLLAGERVVIVDFDSAVAGDPAFDLGLFIAHLERGALRGSVHAGLVEPARDTLLQGYEAATRRPAPDRVGLYVAAGLLRLAPHPFRNLRPNWPQAIEATIARSEAILEGLVVRTFGGLRSTPRRDTPALSSQRSNGHTHTDDRLRSASISVVDPFGVTRDPAMPFLAQALNPLDAHLQLSRRLRFAPATSGREAQLRVLGIRVTRHKPGRRCLIEYDMVVERPGAPPEAFTAVGKVRARGLDKATYETNVALWNAGFGSDSMDGISVPQPIGMVPEFQMWLHRKVPGVPLTELLAREGGVGLAQRIAEVAHKLHTAGVKPKRKHAMSDEIRILHESLPLVAEREPGWARRIERVLAACDRLGASLSKPTLTGIHRDFYPDQVVADDARLYLLDLDLYCQGDPGLDIGNFLGHVQEWSLREYGDPRALADRENALLERFVALAGEQVREAVSVYTTLTLARHIYISTRFPDRRLFTQSLLELCEDALAQKVT